MLLIELEDHSQKLRHWHATVAYGESSSGAYQHGYSAITPGHEADDRPNMIEF